MESSWRLNVQRWGLWTLPKGYGAPTGYCVLAARQPGPINKYVGRITGNGAAVAIIFHMNPSTGEVSPYASYIPSPLYPHFPFGLAVLPDH